MSAPSATPREPTIGPLSWPRLKRAPMVPITLVFTIGLILDRYFVIPLGVSLLASMLALVAWLIGRLGRDHGLSLVYLGLAVIGLGTMRHHDHVHTVAPDDVSHFADEEARLVRLQGSLATEPARRPARDHDPLRTRPREASASVVVTVQTLALAGDWHAVSGRVMVHAPNPLLDLHVGDEVEVIGWLIQTRSPGNPGERDRRAALRDDQIRAELFARDTPRAIVRLRQGWPDSLQGWLTRIQAWGRASLEEHLSEDRAGLASALLLGDRGALESEAWDRFARAGVLHVLAISGQHLGVLALFVGFLLRLMGMHPRRIAVIVAMFVLAYALMTGGRPPALRAALMVTLFCGGILLGRPALSVNVLATAWLLLAVLDPTQPFTAGWQLSFVATAVLIATGHRLARHEPEGIDRLVEDARPMWQKAGRAIGRTVLIFYTVNALIVMTVSPLICYWNHVVSPAALLIGPIVMLLSSTALVAGFLLLLTSLLPGDLLASPFASVTEGCLIGCEWLVNFGNRLPVGHLYLDAPPTWWLIGFFGGLVGWLTWDHRRVPIERWTLGGLAVWLIVGLAPSLRPSDDELRVTFLDVGHGCCVVIRTPDGRILLYDAGSLAGPEVARHQIAPYLWHHGITRIDEVFLSHADIDHFNGLPDLMERFPIGRVTTTATFLERDSLAVQLLANRFERAGTLLRIVSTGDRFTAGDVSLTALHPPAEPLPGPENVRSLLLLIEHHENKILLTGDLEGIGLRQILSSPPIDVDVLMAPHHGSRASNTPDLATWASPKLVVSTQTRSRWPARHPNPYQDRHIPVMDTWHHGAITIRSGPRAITVSTFRTQERVAIRSGI